MPELICSCIFAVNERISLKLIGASSSGLFCGDVSGRSETRKIRCNLGGELHWRMESHQHVGTEMLTMPSMNVRLDSTEISTETCAYMYVIEHVRTSISKSGLCRLRVRTSETSLATVRQGKK